ncbi:caspase-7 isoform X2 [Hydra vulgaris]|uniref:Caspase-7 isoform X2 n=1 Tax=Hydra vulgaris TaxID=6087 RepID=A0ABM4BD40_HYDVU
MALASDSAISSSFRVFIAKVTDELTVLDLRKLKFLLKENLPAGVIEKINDAYMYMETLENKELITRNNLTFLKQSFSLIGRNDLERKINEFVKNDQLGQPDKSVDVQTNNRELYQSCNDQSKPTGSLSVSPHGLPDSNDKHTIGKKTYECEMTSLVDRSPSDERNKNLIISRDSKPQTIQPKLMKPGEFLPSKSNHMQPSENSLEISVQETRPKDSSLYYTLNRNPVGICHIISNSFNEIVESEDKERLSRRTGTQKDVIELVKAFSWLNFKIDLHYDKDAQSILDIIKAPPLNEEKFDCFVCCILSHGFQDGVYGADGKKLDFSDMQTAICGSSAKWLIGKPKLFFIQACQGNAYEKEVLLADSPGINHGHKTSGGRKSLPENADFCFSVSANPGTVSWRNTKDGSWYIQALCEVLKENAVSESLLDMLTVLNAKLCNKVDEVTGTTVKQMSTIRIMTLTKLLRFKPLRPFREQAFELRDQISQIEEYFNSIKLN